MEEHKSLHKPDPGIPEALYPEIGNSSALEKDKHAFLLRTPDPSKQLENFIAPEQLPEEEFIADSNPVLSTNPSIVHSEAVLDAGDVAAGDDVKAEEETNSDPIIPDIPEIELNQPKPLKKKKASKDKKVVEEELPDENTPEEPGKKQQKAGKLLRKAAKSVKKQETAQKMSDEGVAMTSEPSLSPFTSWLKNLSGSDYVHPYEDDFAFEQASGPGRTGISETFADLLAAQGYKEQAREMYIKLMEKYPEKSGFFAAKIEALQ